MSTETATTEELFDCSIDEFPVNARTRGTLKRAGITTLSGLQHALLSDDDLPGLGPKAGEDIEQALDVLGADRERKDRERRDALVAIFAARERVANVLMHTTDLMFQIDAGFTKGKRLNEPVLRTATAKLLRESLHDMTRALRVLAPELPEMEYEAEDSEELPS